MNFRRLYKHLGALLVSYKPHTRTRADFLKKIHVWSVFRTSLTCIRVRSLHEMHPLIPESPIVDSPAMSLVKR